MSKFTTLKDYIYRRLTVAAEEIFELFENTIVEYEVELLRKQELLDAVLKPEVRLRRVDVQLLSANEDDSLEHQDWSTSLHQHNPAELPQFKEEKELWTSNGGEQHQAQEEANSHTMSFTFSGLLVKQEDDDGEEKPQSSQLLQIETEHNIDAEHLKKEADGRSDPAAEEEMSYASESESADGAWEETSEPQSGLNPPPVGGEPLKQTALLSYRGDHSVKKGFNCLVCKRHFQSRADFIKHMLNHTKENPFSCSVCGRRFSQEKDLKQHAGVHSVEKPFSCSYCYMRFASKEHLRKHANFHIKQPYICSDCGARFSKKAYLVSHTKTHIRASLFSCFFCSVRFTHRSNLYRHLKTHSGGN